MLSQTTPRISNYTTRFHTPFRLVSCKPTRNCLPTTRSNFSAKPINQPSPFARLASSKTTTADKPSPTTIVVKLPSPPPNDSSDEEEHKFLVVPVKPSSSTLPSRLNPPASTRPPPISLPSRSPSESRFRYLFNTGRAYLTFYKTGLKAIYENNRLSRPIRRCIRARFLLPHALHQEVITRAEYHLVRRTRSDILRLPLFALIFLICGEFTPLIVIALSNLVPPTLWVPRQIAQAREKIEARRREARNMWAVIPTKYDPYVKLGPVETEVVLVLGRALGLYAQWWESLPTMIPAKLIRGRLNRRLETIAVDDGAIRREGGIADLEPEEVTLAVEMRGMDVLGKGEEELRRDLQRWMDDRKKATVLENIRERLREGAQSTT